MSETLALTPSESVTVQDSSHAALDVEATYAPHGSPPPRHLHPSQAEHFEVLEGSILTRVNKAERRLMVGDTLDVPARTEHQIWNPGDMAARVSWRTAPAGRTLEWFRALDALQQ